MVSAFSLFDFLPGAGIFGRAVHRRGARAAIPPPPPPPRHETFDPTVDAGNVQFVLVTYICGGL